MSFHTHINLIHIKVTSLAEAEVFYDAIFEHLGLKSKDKSDQSITYWGPFGLMLHKQNDVLAHIDHNFRLGVFQISIRLESKEKIDEVFDSLNKLKFTYEWKPKKLNYSENYYSTLVFDPDDNKIEFVFDV